MKQSKTTIKELTKRYRTVLLKCLLLNSLLFVGIETAIAEETQITEGIENALIEVRDNVRITDGTFNNVGFFTTTDVYITIEGGSFGGYTDFTSDSITVSGGTFNSSKLEIEADELLISGGAFNSTFVEIEAEELTVSGGRFNSRFVEIEAGTINIDEGQTLNIGEGSLSADSISGGTIKLSLPSTEVSSAIITASSATGVSLDVDMSKVSRENAVQYVLTSTDTGYTLTNVNNSRYAFSTGAFSLEDYKADPTSYLFAANWTGGELYILRLTTAGEAAVENLNEIGVSVSFAEEKAIEALSDEVIETLAPAQKAVVQKINSLLDSASGNVAQTKQILREIAPETAPSSSSTASSNAIAVMNVVSGRMGGGRAAPAVQDGSDETIRGRSGGDYTSGALSVWAQGMYNKADLHKNDGFDSDTSGFAAGFEYNVNDSVKVGFGYAYADTEIGTVRSKTDVDTHTGFVYGEYKPNNFYVNGTLSYGHSKYDETTNSIGLNSEYHANTFAGQLMAGYTFDFLTPEAGLRYVGVRQRGYMDALGTKMSAQTLDDWTWVGGVKVSKSFRTGKAIITPDAKIMATYDFKRDGQARTVTLANGAAYVAKGENMKRFGVETGVGLSANIGNKVDIGLSYEGKFKDHYTDHTGLINFKYNF